MRSNGKARSCVVSVVPTLLPKTKARAFSKASSSASTKDTAITVKAVLDWSTAVETDPLQNPRHGVAVIQLSTWWRRSPANDWSPCRKIRIPQRRRHRPSTRVIKYSGFSSFQGIVLARSYTFQLRGTKDTCSDMRSRAKLAL